jgi:hypothetical protein
MYFLEIDRKAVIIPASAGYDGRRIGGAVKGSLDAVVRA